MKQAVKKSRKKAQPKPKKETIRLRGRDGKFRKEFGTSKLEQDFARDFLEKLKVPYEWQFEAKDIKRFYDFYLPKHNVIIEIDGSWYHSDPRLVKESEMNPMQKHNKRVDGIKDKWAALHGIHLLRIWEKDIRERPSQVMEWLQKWLHIDGEKVRLRENKNKRHVNKISKKDD